MAFTKNQWLTVLGGVLVLVVLFATPAIWYGSWGLDGADDAAGEMVMAIKSGYEPWIESLWEPSDLGETLLFGVQAAIGIVFMIYYGITLKKKTVK